MRRKITLFGELILDLFAFFSMKLKTIKHSDKMVYIDFEFPQLYHRYFYTLIKNIQLAGYQIIYPVSFSTFRNLRNKDEYLAFLFRGKQKIIIRNIGFEKHMKLLNGKLFSEDYYQKYFENNNLENNSYHIPMTMHPKIYENDFWKELPKVKKINSIFCFGNFDRIAYKTLKNAPFDVVDRASIIDFCAKIPHFVSIQSKKELEDHYQNNVEKKLIFVEKQNYQIPMKDVREILSRYRYFLCCPGVFAPLSHNFVEAISCGCVPIIQKGYADLIYPALTNFHNAIIFKDLDELQDLIQQRIFEISDQKFNEMQNQVNQYYLEYYHPIGFTKNLMQNLDKKTLYLNASERSVKKIRK